MALTTPDDVAALLRWGTAEKAKYASQLPALIAAADDIIEQETGPIDATPVTYVADGGPSVTVPQRVNSVTSVSVNGTTLATDQYTVDAAAGIIYGPFNCGRGAVTIVYETGYAEVPPAVKFAATALVAHMWNVTSQRGPGFPEDYTAAPTGFLVPNVVKEALAPYSKMPGFA